MASKKIPAANNRARKVNGELVTTCEIMGPVIIDLVRAGMTPSRAAEANRISKSTVSVWISRGIAETLHRERGGEPNKSEEVYMQFSEGIAKAESESMGALVLAWFKEARAGDWKAAERFLSRRFPQEWGDNNTVKLEVSAGAGFGNNNDNRDKELTATEDEERKRAILSALVESGDLPSNVLNAWDEEDDIIDAEIVEPKE